jgi:hypothetical protein
MTYYYYTHAESSPLIMLALVYKVDSKRRDHEPEAMVRTA